MLAPKLGEQIDQPLDAILDRSLEVFDAKQRARKFAAHAGVDRRGAADAERRAERARHSFHRLRIVETADDDRRLALRARQQLERRFEGSARAFRTRRNRP